MFQPALFTGLKVGKSMHYLATTLTMRKLPSQSKLRQSARQKNSVIRFFRETVGEIAKHTRQSAAVC